MKKLTISSLALLVIGFAPVALADEDAANISGPGHWDIGAVEHGGALELQIGQHVGTNHTHYVLNGSTISYNFGTNAKVDVEKGTNNLGSLWVTPHDEVDADAMGMPFIGFSAKELSATNGWTGLVTFTMTGFSFTTNSFTVGLGTGNFFMFEDDLFFDSRSTNAFGNYGSFSVGVGQHAHGEFGFSDAGLYAITLVASGTNNGTAVSGDPATFTFDVVPEPSTYALLGLGAGALALLRWRKR
ncbi:MAG: choice-of-anchor M domain-containing protein, partial [Sphaerospermopsis kisseleviana]